MAKRSSRNCLPLSSSKALTVGTAKELAQRMAGMTRIIRDLIVSTFEHEKEQGWLHNWLGRVPRDPHPRA